MHVPHLNIWKSGMCMLQAEAAIPQAPEASSKVHTVACVKQKLSLVGHAEECENVSLLPQSPFFLYVVCLIAGQNHHHPGPLPGTNSLLQIRKLSGIPVLVV